LVTRGIGIVFGAGAVSLLIYCATQLRAADSFDRRVLLFGMVLSLVAAYAGWSIFRASGKAIRDPLASTPREMDDFVNLGLPGCAVLIVVCVVMAVAGAAFVLGAIEIVSTLADGVNVSRLWNASTTIFFATLAIAACLLVMRVRV
jgi:hypothetical protein